jgi:hypothetical protein
MGKIMGRNGKHHGIYGGHIYIYIELTLTNHITWICPDIWCIH